jgi:hypothetical protein
MKQDEFRRRLEFCRQLADREAAEQKDSHLVFEKLRDLYQTFDPDERASADAVFSDWALAKDESVRFDALALIDELKIVTAAPALETLVLRLGLHDTPGAPYEVKKVERILKNLIDR